MKPVAAATGHRHDVEPSHRGEGEIVRVKRLDDQQIVCITLETNILFVRRLTAHVSQCPRSPYARLAEAWQRAGIQYTAQFNDRRCKPAIKSYRG